MNNYRSLNQVILQGRLGANAEVKQTKGGQAFLTFSVATQSSSKDASGNWSHPTTWHACKFFGPRAEKLAPMLVKGASVTLIGSLANFESLIAGRKSKFTYVNVDDVTGVEAPKGASTSYAGGSSAPAYQPGASSTGREGSRTQALQAAQASNQADANDVAVYF